MPFCINTAVKINHLCMCVSAVSRYINAFAFTQLCGVLCAPWNGLIMDRHKGKPRAAGTTLIVTEPEHLPNQSFVTGQKIGYKSPIFD